jgi:dTDP-glucose 4,6-dehydratase
MERILITGGLGFIGSHLIERIHNNKPQSFIINADCSTYAANSARIADLKKLDRYTHVDVDVREKINIRDLMHHYKPDHVIHLAAESHVCRSIEGPGKFFQTNAMGTFNLIDEFRLLWKDELFGHKFHYISTDEIFGELPLDDPSQLFHVEQKLSPRSPYAASKACGNHIVQAFHHTYGMHTIITACTNNFGPWQHEEKLVPKTIKALRLGLPVTIYGTGKQVRDWIYVLEHCRAIEMAFDQARAGSFYVVGGKMELSNLQMVEAIARAMSKFRKVDLKLEFANARPTDDLRYGVDNSRIEREIGFHVRSDLWNQQLEETVRWFLANQ